MVATITDQEACMFGPIPYYKRFLVLSHGNSNDRYWVDPTSWASEPEAKAYIYDFLKARGYVGMMFVWYSKSDLLVTIIGPSA